MSYLFAIGLFIILASITLLIVLYVKARKTADDCQGKWNDWSECSKSCGGGVQTRDFDVSKQPSHGGKACPAPQTRYCNTQECTGPDTPVNCAGEWGDWSKCTETCGGGVQTRSFNVTTQPKNGGDACPAPQHRACNTEDCAVVDCSGSWGDWSKCSKSCGGGVETRSFNIKTHPANGGKACPVDQQQTCNTQVCPHPDPNEPVDCEGNWGDWSNCTETCGGGIQTRSFNITTHPANGGKLCPASQHRACNTEECPPIDCAGSWGSWSNCSKSCGGGEQSRVFNITTHPANGGKECPVTQHQTCNLQPCNCSGTCGGFGGFGGKCAEGCKCQPNKFTGESHCVSE